MKSSWDGRPLTNFEEVITENMETKRKKENKKRGVQNEEMIIKLL